MSEVKIEQPFPALKEKDILRFEKKLGNELPLDYKQFLLRSNGGIPAPNVFPITGNRRDNKSMLGLFFGLKQSNYNGLEYQLDEIGERFPKELLPIGDDLGGNLLCLAISGENRGKVYFWELEGETDEGKPPDYSNVYFVADSFNELLEKFTFPDWE